MRPFFVRPSGGKARGKGQHLLSLGSGNAGKRAFSEDRNGRLPRGDRVRTKDMLPDVLPAPPSIARQHKAYVIPPMDQTDLELHIKKLKHRLTTLLQARDANALVGRGEDCADNEEIACTKHMIFAAMHPPSTQVSKTQEKILKIETELIDAKQKEREALDRRMALESSLGHFRICLQELKEA